MNNTVIIGRLVKDVELKYTQSNVATCSFTLAVNRSFKNAQGEREADFINCVAWRKTAEILSTYTHKGSQVAISGRIQTRNYENQQGQRIYVTEVVAEEVQLLDPKPQTQQPQQQSDPFANYGSSINISDEDLPFG